MCSPTYSQHGTCSLRAVQVAVSSVSRLLKKAFSCFDRLSTNGKSPTTSSLPPFALSLSKGERRVFQQPAKGQRSAASPQLSASSLLSWSPLPWCRGNPYVVALWGCGAVTEA